VVRDILIGVGDDVEREGLRATPERISRLYHELPAGYAADPVALVNGALFQAEYDEMVVVRAIEFSSLCEHHLLPFIG
jgi:GTP cyclohydrolase IA